MHNSLYSKFGKIQDFKGWCKIFAKAKIEVRKNEGFMRFGEFLGLLLVYYKSLVILWVWWK